jgi:hypothetical protein
MLYIKSMDESHLEFAHTDLAEQALRDEAKKLQDEEGLSADDAMRVAAATMDGAGDHEGKTVESMQTCMDLFGKPVKGLSGDDIPEERSDKYAVSEVKRHEAADRNMDLTALWLKLSAIDGGKPVADKIVELVDSKQEKLSRFWHLVRACVEKGYYDDEVVGILGDAVGIEV